MITKLFFKLKYLVAINTPEDVESLVSKIHENKNFGTVATNFPPERIFSSILFSLFGIAYFIYGKKSAEFQFIFTGMALMGFTYFVKDILYIVICGTTLVLLPHILRRF